MQNKNANVKYEQRIGDILYDVHFKATRDKNNKFTAELILELTIGCYRYSFYSTTK